MNNGVIYIATGDRYINEAIVSAKSLKYHSPEMPVTILTSKLINHDCFDQEILIENPAYNWQDKISQMYASPYEQTLFIDTDTFICADISQIFSLLAKFDLAAVHATFREDIYQVKDVPKSFTEMNTGVILYKKSPQVAQVFRNWLNIYQEQLKQPQKPPHDQASFRQALYESQLRIGTLATEYNCRFVFPVSIDGEVKILHGRYPNLDFLAQEINSQHQPRVFKINSKAWKFKIALHRLQKTLTGSQLAMNKS